MDKKTNIKAYSAAIFFSVLVGFSFLGIKTCVPLANSLQILVHRYNFAFFALLLLLALRIARLDLRGKPKKKSDSYRRILCGLYGTAGNRTVLFFID